MCQPLAENWFALAGTLSVPPEYAQSLFADLAARYAEPHRHYHTLDHLKHMFSVVDLLCCPQSPGPALLLAVWFHDAVYDPRAADNEVQSAALAQRRLAPWVAQSVLAETTRLIGLTQRHETTAEDGVGQILLDADLAILAAEPAEYDRYALAIRREYAWVTELDYRAGRKSVLQRFLDRTRLFHTERMFTTAEDSARANLRREIGQLGEL